MAQKTLWVGFEVAPAGKEALNKLVGRELKETPYFAVLFRHEEREMKEWYEKEMTKSRTGTISKIISNEKKTFCVAYINYVKPEFVILYNNTNMRPIQLKQHIMSPSNAHLLQTTILNPRIVVPLMPIKR